MRLLQRRSAHAALLLGAAGVPVGIGSVLHAEHLDATEQCRTGVRHVAPPVTNAAPAVAIEVPVPIPTAPPPAPAAESVPMEYGRQVAFVNQGEHGPVVVIAVDAPKTWGDRKNMEVLDDDREAIRVPAVATKTPLAHLAWEGRTVDVYSATAKICTASVQRPYLYYEVSGATEMFDDEQWDQWERDPGSIDFGPLLWGGATLKLQADLTPIGGDCEGALWARDAELPPPVLMQPSDAHPVLTEDGRRTLRKSKAYRDAHRDYRLQIEDLGDLAYVQELPKSLLPNIDTTVFADHSDGSQIPRLVVHEASSDVQESCGGLYVDFWQAVDPATGLALGPDPDQGVPMRVAAVFDVNGDGRLEVLDQRPYGETVRLWTIDDDGLRHVEEATWIDFYGCRC